MVVYPCNWGYKPSNTWGGNKFREQVHIAQQNWGQRRQFLGDSNLPMLVHTVALELFFHNNNPTEQSE